MITTSPQTSSTATSSTLSSMESLQFEWLSRAGRLSGMAILVVTSDMQIRFYDPLCAEILELNESEVFSNTNLLDIIEQLAKRGDFGPGDPAIFVELVKNEFSKSKTGNNLEDRSLNFLTPSGRRIEFRVDLEMDGFFLLACRDITKSYVEKHALKVALNNSN